MADRSMPSSFDDNHEHQETGSKKVWRKLREEPLIPLGTLLTCAAFYNAWRASRRGDHAQVQRMFRARIGAQFFTICAIVAGGAYYGADRDKRAELIKLEANKRAKDRHETWLRELEVRDEEEKALKAHLKRREERRTGHAEKTSAIVAAATTGMNKDRDEDSNTKADAASSPDSGGQASRDPDKQKSSSGVLEALSKTGSWFGTGRQTEKKDNDAEGRSDNAKASDEEDKPKSR